MAHPMVAHPATTTQGGHFHFISANSATPANTTGAVVP